MEFGRVPAETLDHIHFDLPADPAFNTSVLSGIKAVNPKVYIGCAKWAATAAGKGFKFCPKMYQGITHRGALGNKQFALDEYLRGVVAFEDKLGPIFVQVSDSFSTKRKDELFSFLAKLPTVPKTFIRYVGNSLHPTDFTRVDQWIERMKTWLDKGMEELYFFMHMHDEAYSPELTVYLVDKLNAAAGLSLQKPVFIQEQQLLF